MSDSNYRSVVDCRLALGTAQFGMAYGVANSGGQVVSTEVQSILRGAYRAGIDTLDTAVSYGECESILGDADISHWRVITKLPALPEHVSDVVAWVHSNVASSLQRLKVNALDGLLLHHPDDLLGKYGSEYIAALKSIKNSGMASAVGVSIYDPNELDKLSKVFNFDLVQAPLNVIDRRLVTSGWLKRLGTNGVRVHARSVFMQGLLLMTKDSRPGYFAPWQNLLDGWMEWCVTLDKSPLQMALNFVLAQSSVERVIVGVDSVAQLNELIDAAVTEPICPPRHLQSNDVALINPSSWMIK
jgi:aryl-alcohol dehydrogenase-like predicted oxidoreductase